MKNSFLRPSAGNATIFLGLMLVLISVGGLVIDTHPLGIRNQPGDEGGKVIRSVHPSQARATLQTPQSVKAQALPKLESTMLPTTTRQPIETTRPDAGTEDNQFLVPGTPPPTVIPLPQSLAPQRIIIPAIHLDANVVPAGYEVVEIDGQVFQQWGAPDEFAAGWMQTSAFLGMPGNTVLTGHNNIFGAVFGNLLYLQPGDTIDIHSGDWIFSYMITNKMILPERGEPISVRLENARWMQPTNDERLTLVTCWPPISNTHRLIIVARPVSKRLSSGGQSP